MFRSLIGYLKNDFFAYIKPTCSMMLMVEEQEIFNVHNTHNKLVGETFINNILKRFNVNYTVNDISVFQRALTHKSYIIPENRKKTFNNEDFTLPSDGNTYIPLQHKSNERLEWMGDGIIQSVVAQYLYVRYDQDEGFLTKTRSKLVRTEALAKLARYLKLPQYILMSKYMEESGRGRENPKLAEDAFEAFIGAMSEDMGNNAVQGYSICYKFFINLIEQIIDFAELIQRDDNYKDQLMRYCHQRFNGQNPTYEQASVTSEKKSKMYTEVVRNLTNKKQVIGKGTARSRKEAQQEAAKQALAYYRAN